jgi:hypothetical protein
MSRGRVGILVNPMAGRDIRRLVALADTASGPAKILSVRRLIHGLRFGGGVDVLLIDDPEGLAAEVASQERGVRVLADDTRLRGTDLTRHWVDRFMDRGIDVLVSIGGDGTQRAVALAQCPAPVLPIAGGTNNVLAWSGDQTLAGMAAAAVARGGGGSPLVRRAKRFRIMHGAGEDLALVDVAQIATPFIGALAVYDARLVRRLLLNVADLARPGLSNVGGFADPVSMDDDWSLSLRLRQRGGRRTPAVMAPGLVDLFRVDAALRVPLGTPEHWRLSEPSTIAVDGERTIALRADDEVRVVADRQGLRLIHPDALTLPPA